MKTVSELAVRLRMNAADVEQVVATWKQVVANASHYSLPELAAIVDSVAGITDQEAFSSKSEDIEGSKR